MAMSASAYLIVTNNEQIRDAYRDHPLLAVEYLEGKSFLDVLVCVRDYVHQGWKLLTHPQASNLKPMQSTVKSVLITSAGGVQPRENDIEMIEGAIAGYQKFSRGKALPAWPDAVRRDFCTIDRSVLESAINSPGLQNRMRGGQ